MRNNVDVARMVNVAGAYVENVVYGEKPRWG
jgi:hypothetical protein